VWKIAYSRSSLRALRKIPRNIAETIQKKIAALATDPHAPNNNATRLQGRTGYRLRVGEHDAEMLEDIRAFDAAKTRNEEAFPSEVAQRLAAGESPIRVFREHRGLTQERLASAAKIARPYLAELEAGRKQGSVSVLRAIAAALKLDLDDIAAC
jgi:DNA-binding XRE family transcriptional regulator